MLNLETSPWKHVKTFLTYLCFLLKIALDWQSFAIRSRKVLSCTFNYELNKMKPSQFSGLQTKLTQPGTPQPALYHPTVRTAKCPPNSPYTLEGSLNTVVNMSYRTCLLFINVIQLGISVSPILVAFCFLILIVYTSFFSFLPRA